MEASSAASVSTRVTSQTMPSVSSRSRISSVSLGSSSIERIRNGDRMLLPHTSRRRLVDDCPENAQFLDGINKLMKVNRLYHVRVHSEFVARHHVLFLFR